LVCGKRLSGERLTVCDLKISLPTSIINHSSQVRHSSILPGKSSSRTIGISTSLWAEQYGQMRVMRLISGGHEALLLVLILVFIWLSCCAFLIKIICKNHPDPVNYQSKNCTLFGDCWSNCRKANPFMRARFRERQAELEMGKNDGWLSMGVSVEGYNCDWNDDAGISGTAHRREEKWAEKGRVRKRKKIAP